MFLDWRQQNQEVLAHLVTCPGVGEGLAYALFRRDV